MNDEQLRMFTHRTDELKDRINEGALPYDWVMAKLQEALAMSKPETPISAIIAEPSILPPRPMSIVVDCDADSTIPHGLFLTGEGTEHRKMGKITLEKRGDGKLYANGTEVVRYIPTIQRKPGGSKGREVREELKDAQVLNACILDALSVNRQLIPDEWKTGYIYSWGTIFRSKEGYLYVECLDCHNDERRKLEHWLDDDVDRFDKDDFVLSLKS